MNAERSAELWSAYLEGELDSAGMQELQKLFETEPDSVKRAVDLYEIHRWLGQIHQTAEADSFTRSTLIRIQSDSNAFIGSLRERLQSAAPQKPHASWGTRVAILTAALIALALLLHFIQSSVISEPPSTVASTNGTSALSVATLVRTDRARWEPDVALMEGQRIETGPLRLGTGSAMLLFDSGAIVALKSPAKLEIESRGSVRLLQGRITVRAEGDAAGFTVRTPAGDAKDLGTEFSVAVAISGASEIHVNQGEVAWIPKEGAPPTRVLRAGEAARFDSLREVEGQPIVFAAQTIDDFLKQFSANLLPEKYAAYEGFDYAAGSMKPELAAGGSGWKSPWRLRRGAERTRESDTNDIFTIVPNSLPFASLPATTGGAAELPPGNSIRVRELAEPIDLGRDAVYYVSFRVRRVTNGAPMPKGSPHFRVTFRSSKDFWSDSVGVGLPASGHPTLQLLGRNTYVAPIDIENDSTTFWVLKIVSSRTRPDEAFLKVFKPGESMPLFEPAPWSVVSDRFPAEGLLDLLVLTGTGPIPHIVDELRVGRTWGSVVRKD